MIEEINLFVYEIKWLIHMSFKMDEIWINRARKW